MRWLSYNPMWILELSHGAFDTCTYTDELIMAHNLVTEISESWHVAKLVYNLLFTATRRRKVQFGHYSSADAGSRHISSSESDIYMVICWRLYAGVKAYWFQTGFAFSNIDELGFELASPLGMLDCDCGFTEPSLICLLPGRESLAAFCDIPGHVKSLHHFSKLLLVEVPERHPLFAAGRRPDPTIRWCVLLISFTK